jgi:PAS domain S-box-containing protein
MDSARPPVFSAPELLSEIASQMARLGGWELIVASGMVYWDDEVALTHGMPHIRRLTRQEALAPYVAASRHRFERLLEACIHDGTPFDDEFELATAAGRTVWLRGIGRALRDGSGRVASVHGACQDITELKNAQQRAQGLGAELQATLESMSDAFVMLDAGQRIVYVNRVAAHAARRRREDLLGAVLWDAFPHARGTKYETETTRAMAQRVPVVFEEYSPPPVDRWFEVRVFPSPAGGLAIYFRDVTERRVAEAVRRADEAKLWQAQKMESLGTLAGGIAHDFNNVLGAVLGNAGLMLAQMPADHPLRDKLENISVASQRARDLVRRILAFSRTDSGQMHPTVQPLAPVLCEALDMLRVMLPSGVDLRRAVSSREVFANVDATSIQQVLMNLCTNAWQALDQGGGWVEVGLQPVALSAAQARGVSAALPAGDYAHVWVSDNGGGIDEATRRRLFEPFFTTKPRGQGTGLGLPVVHGIVEAHHGVLQVESEVGRGSAFHVYLPACASAVARPVVEHPAPVVAGRPGRRVLLVDDDLVVLLTTEQVLRRFGHEVLAHADPLQALAAFEADAGTVDVVVTDFSMPGLSGLELAERLIRLRPGLPVVLISGYIADEVRARAGDIGVAALVNKENMFEELGPAIDAALRERGKR